MKYKYNEDSILEEFEKYIRNTYGQHYSAFDEEEIQTFELIKKKPYRGFSAAIANVIKYADRCEDKNQTEQDLLKAMHYSLLALHCWREHLKKTKPTNNNRTFGRDIPLLEPTSFKPDIFYHGDPNSTSVLANKYVPSADDVWIEHTAVKGGKHD